MYLRNISQEQPLAGEIRDQRFRARIGQHSAHLPVQRFVHPDQFLTYKRVGEAMGIGHVESGPMVRSSYHADRQAAKVSKS